MAVELIKTRLRSIPWQCSGYFALALLGHVALLNLASYLLQGVPVYHASQTIINTALLMTIALVITMFTMVLMLRISIWRMTEQIFPIWVSGVATGLVLVILLRFSYSTVYLVMITLGSVIILLLLSFALKKTTRMRIIVMDGVDLGESEKPIVISYATAKKTASTIDALVVTQKQMQAQEWRGFLTGMALNHIPVMTDTYYRELNEGWVDLYATNAEELIQLRFVRRYAVIKRILDIAVAASGLILLSPLMLLVAILIRLETPGNPIFIQHRTGLRGKPFRMLKFRSMVADAAKHGKPFTNVNDDRITFIGRIIRPIRIDELPQLINVLLGSMSVIGPRPEEHFLNNQLEAEIPHYAFRLAVRPGITGWAQVMQGYVDDLKSTETKLSYDLFYIKNMSLMMDMVIFFRTIKTIVTGFGAR